MKHNLTLTTAWYNLKAKYDSHDYYAWMKNLLTNVHHFNLVVYSDDKSIKAILPYIQNNTNISVVIKPLHTFHTYRYKDYWIENHKRNTLYRRLNLDWQMNMLWAEKMAMVYDTMNNKDYNTDFYGWCDIGYFRCRQNKMYTYKEMPYLNKIPINHKVPFPNDISPEHIKMWPNHQKMEILDKNKIHYGLMQNDEKYMEQLKIIINNRNDDDLPIIPIPPSQESISGGFFLSYKKKLKWWYNTFYERLERYFEHHYLVKDDQIIIADCVFSDSENNFQLWQEHEPKYDHWFMFQRKLL